LAEQFDSIVELYPSQFERVNRAIEQAKEMEKERMIEFAQLYAVIHCMGDITKNADEYYNETKEVTK
jgi:hypothetical protein